jgi:hypothetical protein
LYHFLVVGAGAFFAPEDDLLALEAGALAVAAGFLFAFVAPALFVAVGFLLALEAGALLVAAGFLFAEDVADVFFALAWVLCAGLLVGADVLRLVISWLCSSGGGSGGGSVRPFGTGGRSCRFSFARLALITSTGSAEMMLPWAKREKAARQMVIPMALLTIIWPPDAKEAIYLPTFTS